MYHIQYTTHLQQGGLCVKQNVEDVSTYAEELCVSCFQFKAFSPPPTQIKSLAMIRVPSFWLYWVTHVMLVQHEGLMDQTLLPPNYIQLHLISMGGSDWLYTHYNYVSIRFVNSYLTVDHETQRPAGRTPAPNTIALCSCVASVCFYLSIIYKNHHSFLVIGHAVSLGGNLTTQGT